MENTYNDNIVLTTNPKTLYNNLTLLKNENVLEAIESFDKYNNKGSKPTDAYIKARIKNLFRHVRQDLKRNTKPEEFKIIQELINSNELDNMLYAYDEYITSFLADIKLISTATTREYDVQNAIDEDDAKGL